MHSSIRDEDLLSKNDKQIPVQTSQLNTGKASKLPTVLTKSSDLNDYLSLGDDESN